MIRLQYSLSVCLMFAVFTSCHKFPTDLERCKYSDSHCLGKVMTSILHSQYKGHPGLNIFQFDPLHVKTMVLEKIPGSPVSVELKFNEFDITGLHEGTVLNITGFTKKASDLIFEMHQIYPKFVVMGPYSIDGSILSHPIIGQGNGVIAFHDMRVITKVKCTTVEKGGETYLNVVDTEVDLRPKKVTFALDNLYDGDNTLGDNMNQLLNDYWDVVFSEMKPLFQKAFSRLGMYINVIFSNIPYDELFLKSE